MIICAATTHIFICQIFLKIYSHRPEPFFYTCWKILIVRLALVIVIENQINIPIQCLLSMSQKIQSNLDLFIVFQKILSNPSYFISLVNITNPKQIKQNVITVSSPLFLGEHKHIISNSI